MVGTGFADATAGGGASILVALAVGAACGLVNGLGAAFVRIPSMIFTLGLNAVLQGLMVLYTGGPASVSSAPRIVGWMSGGQLVLSQRDPVRAAAGIAAAVLLRSTVFGRTIYAIGNRERAA